MENQMTRKMLIAVIALIYLISGILSFCNSWTPSSSVLFNFNFYRFVGGVLALYAGFAMFRLNEFGRKLIVILLSIRVIMNVLLVLRVLKVGDGLGVENRFGEVIYRIESPYVFQGFLLAWILVAMLTISFLSQKETKAIFAPEVTKDVEPDIVFE
jgi:hypothetical protein